MGKNAKNRKAAKPLKDNVGKEFEPIRIDSAANAEALENAERVVIFSIDDVDYSMPKAPQADIALEYMALEREGRADEAATVLFERTVGLEALDALRQVKGLTDKQFEGVMVRIRNIALPKGSRPVGVAGRR